MSETEQDLRFTIKKLNEKIIDLQKEVQLKAVKYKEQLLKLKKNKNLLSQGPVIVDYKSELQESRIKQTGVSQVHFSSNKKNSPIDKSCDMSTQITNNDNNNTIMTIIRNGIKLMNAIREKDIKLNHQQPYLVELQKFIKLLSAKLHVCSEIFKLIAEATRQQLSPIAKQDYTEKLFEPILEEMKTKDDQVYMLEILKSSLTEENEELVKRLKGFEANGSIKSKSEVSQSRYNTESNLTESMKSDIKSRTSNKEASKKVRMPHAKGFNIMFQKKPIVCEVCQQTKIQSSRQIMNIENHYNSINSVLSQRIQVLEGRIKQLQTQIDKDCRHIQNSQEKEIIKDSAEFKNTTLAVQSPAKLFRPQQVDITGTDEYVQRQFIRRIIKHKIFITKTIERTNFVNIPTLSPQTDEYK